MPGIEVDPEILQEFLTECGELLESLEVDLLELESDSANAEMINKVFRALHTIKGSASFLALTELVEIAHVAETALNAARNGEITVGRAMMDLLLRAVDVIKQQMTEIGAGSASLTKADPSLVASLGALAEGGEHGDNPDAPGAAPQPADSAGTPGTPGAPGSGRRDLALDPSKADLLGPFVEDLESQLDKLSDQIEMLMDEAARPTLAEQIEDLGRGLSATIDFFEFDSMLEFASTLVETAAAASKAESLEVSQLLPRMRAVLNLLNQQKSGLGEGSLIEPATGELLARLRRVVETGKVDPDWELPVDADDEMVFRIDGVVPSAADEPADQTPETASDAPPTPSGAVDGESNTAAAPSGSPARTKTRAPLVEKTLRVEVNRLESLMNLVGELVLQKNRICELSRRVTLETGVSQDLAEPLELAGGGLDRITGEIQVAVMRTRMQPLDKLFGRYPRLIRDLSQKTGKDMQLKIEGGETEVDKQVIEELGDPLVHLLRNSADHGIEPADERIAAGKCGTGTITLRASHQGNNAVIAICDDGRGLHRDKIGAKALERGLVNEADLAAMSDQEVYRFIFMPGFSTVDAVSDLSGRGVGMDVVRTNIERLKGTVDVSSTPGQGTTMLITIPLTVAILPAMMVKVLNEAYAIPLSNITEIVRPDSDQLATIVRERVIRLRGTVLPLLDATERFQVPGQENAGEGKLAVVLNAEDRNVGLLVTEVIGQQEIVIKPLDGLEKTGPFSGATVRNDGGVSLIIDVAEMIRATA
ncbi:MAG: chemotaxis protein CheA [Phycisphaeraceae bacterium]|nr:MAG: chemotaxis protein CheA [Phycisphaeraceae bacterium]